MPSVKKPMTLKEILTAAERKGGTDVNGELVDKALEEGIAKGWVEKQEYGGLTLWIRNS